jgi:hypothetical protein
MATAAKAATTRTTVTSSTATTVADSSIPIAPPLPPPGMLSARANCYTAAPIEKPPTQHTAPPPPPSEEDELRDRIRRDGLVCLQELRSGVQLKAVRTRRPSKKALAKSAQPETRRMTIADLIREHNAKIGPQLRKCVLDRK